MLHYEGSEIHRQTVARNDDLTPILFGYAGWLLTQLPQTSEFTTGVGAGLLSVASIVAFLRFVQELHAVLGVDVPERDYRVIATIGSCADYLARRLGEA